MALQNLIGSGVDEVCLRVLRGKLAALHQAVRDLVLRQQNRGEQADGSSPHDANWVCEW